MQEHIRPDDIRAQRPQREHPHEAQEKQRGEPPLVGGELLAGAVGLHEGLGVGFVGTGLSVDDGGRGEVSGSGGGAVEAGVVIERRGFFGVEVAGGRGTVIGGLIDRGGGGDVERWGGEGDGGAIYGEVGWG